MEQNQMELFKTTQLLTPWDPQLMLKLSKQLHQVKE
jgi:hypothetical protein